MTDLLLAGIAGILFCIGLELSRIARAVEAATRSGQGEHNQSRR